ncbi:UNVERIFIED_CONTAM: hypothetical protein Sindi_2880400 [Sesamum indicum]
MKDVQAAKKESQGEKRKEAREEAPFKKQCAEFRDNKAPFYRIHTVYTPLMVPITQALMAVEGKGYSLAPGHGESNLNVPSPTSSAVIIMITAILPKNVDT